MDLLTRSMSTWEAFMTFLDDTLHSSTHNIACDRVKHLDMQHMHVDWVQIQTKARTCLQKLWTNKILRKISRKLINGTAYPFSIRETSPKEVWTRSTNSIFNCISYNSSDKHRKQKAWIFINPSGVGNQNSNIETTDARFSKRKNSKREQEIPRMAWCIS